MKLNSNSFIRKKCRLCNSKSLKCVLNFGSTPLANSFLKKQHLKNKEKMYPLRVNFCGNCYHLQLSHAISPKILFNKYLYVSGTSKITRNHFKKYASDVVKKFPNYKKVKIIDIASNDGTFLQNFKHKRFTKLGIDPAKNLSSIVKKKGIKQLPIFFNFKNGKKIKIKFGSFDLIAANNVCAHVDKLKDFVKGVKILLSKKGVFSFEVSYLGDVVNKKTFDTIYHEHLDYHSLKPLINFFKKFDLEIFDFKMIKVQGGSIRIYVSHAGDRHVNKVKINKLLKIEREKYKLYRVSTYKNLQLKIDLHKLKLKKMLKDFKSKNKTLAGYGAPAKTTTLLNYFDIRNNLIDFLVDDSKLKHNLFTPGTHIPIYSREKLYKYKPNLVLLLAWNFSDSIININKRFFNTGGKFIKIYPKIKIVHKC